MPNRLEGTSYTQEEQSSRLPEAIEAIAYFAYIMSQEMQMGEYAEKVCVFINPNIPLLESREYTEYFESYYEFLGGFQSLNFNPQLSIDSPAYQATIAELNLFSEQQHRLVESWLSNDEAFMRLIDDIRKVGKASSSLQPMSSLEADRNATIQFTSKYGTETLISTLAGHPDYHPYRRELYSLTQNQPDVPQPTHARHEERTHERFKVFNLLQNHLKFLFQDLKLDEFINFDANIPVEDFLFKFDLNSSQCRIVVKETEKAIKIICKEDLEEEFTLNGEGVLYRATLGDGVFKGPDSLRKSICYFSRFSVLGKIFSWYAGSYQKNSNSFASNFKDINPSEVGLQGTTHLSTNSSTSEVELTLGNLAQYAQWMYALNNHGNDVLRRLHKKFRAHDLQQRIRSQPISSNISKEIVSPEEADALNTDNISIYPYPNGNPKFPKFLYISPFSNQDDPPYVIPGTPIDYQTAYVVAPNLLSQVYVTANGNKGFNLVGDRYMKLKDLQLTYEDPTTKQSVIVPQSEYAITYNIRYGNYSIILHNHSLANSKLNYTVAYQPFAKGDNRAPTEMEPSDLYVSATLLEKFLATTIHVKELDILRENLTKVLPHQGWGKRFLGITEDRKIALEEILKAFTDSTRYIYTNNSNELIPPNKKDIPILSEAAAIVDINGEKYLAGQCGHLSRMLMKLLQGTLKLNIPNLEMSFMIDSRVFSMVDKGRNIYDPNNIGYGKNHGTVSVIAVGKDGQIYTNEIDITPSVPHFKPQVDAQMVGSQVSTDQPLEVKTTFESLDVPSFGIERLNQLHFNLVKELYPQRTPDLTYLPQEISFENIFSKTPQTKLFKVISFLKSSYSLANNAPISQDEAKFCASILESIVNEDAELYAKLSSLPVATSQHKRIFEGKGHAFPTVLDIAKELLTGIKRL